MTGTPKISDAKPEDDQSAESAPKTHYGVLAAQAEKVAKRNADQADELRKRTELWSKAIATAMTTAVGWITLSRATDVFPPGESGCARVFAVASLVVLAASIVLTWFWFNRQTRPLAMGLDIDTMCRRSSTDFSEHCAALKEHGANLGERGAALSKQGDAYGDDGAALREEGATISAYGTYLEELAVSLARFSPTHGGLRGKLRRWGGVLSEREAREVARIYGEFGALNVPGGDIAQIKDALSGANEFDSRTASRLIRDYAIQAVIHERDAERSAAGGRPLDDPEIVAKLERAAQIRAEVYATQQRAMVTVIRKRVGGLVSGLVSSLALIMFVGGLVGLSYSLDAIDHARNVDKDRLILLNECAKTAEALTKQKIPVVANGAEDGTGVALPEKCGSWSISAKTGEVNVADIQMLSDALAKCRASRTADQAQTECDSIAKALENRAKGLSGS